MSGFKVGDRVRLVTNGGFCSEVKIGQLGTIIHHFGKIFTNGQNCWAVRFDQPHYFSELNFYDSEIELVCPVQQSLPNFVRAAQEAFADSMVFGTGQLKYTAPPKAASAVGINPAALKIVLRNLRGG